MAKITIFGLAGTGTSSVGRELAKKLGYDFVSTGDIFFRKKAEELGLSLSELHERAKLDSAIDLECDEEMKKFGRERDNFVVESRLAWFFIPDSLKVKLFCDLEVRTKRLAERDKLSFEDAASHIIAREKGDDARYKKYYGISDINIDGHFDLVIDSTNAGVEGCVAIILDYKKRFFRP
ncbi:MAG: cytidylate kinase family protein [bacterium]|nr:cytidylate kinase family protein [bacterium]